MKKIILLAFGLLSNVSFSSAQTDTDFWFAAPEVSDSGDHDRPIILKMISGNTPAIVKIGQPAQPPGIGLGTPLTIFMPPNTAFSQDLTAYIDQIESGIITRNIHNDNAVEKKGLHITSSSAISCYYEVKGFDMRTQLIFNSEIFTLKGALALGTQFFTPFQDNFINGSDGWSAIHIVATLDNTHITVTPTRNLVGHPAGIPFTITMNKGETYCGRAISQSSGAHPGGTMVTADNAIAVTIKDDAVRQSSGSDLIGDQLIPTYLVGTDYIVMTGLLYGNGSGGGERAIICATQDNTQVLVNGVLIGTINAGQQINYPITQRNPYIRTSTPAYVFQITGVGNELAGAILPPVICTGYGTASFTRDSNKPFYLNILVKTANVGTFSINGMPSSKIVPSSFSIVTGTPFPGEWSTAQILYSASDIQVGNMYTVSNIGGAFHLSFLNADFTSPGCSYNYLSSYNSSASFGQCLTTTDLNLTMTNHAHPNLFPNPLTAEKAYLNLSGLNAKSLEIAVYDAMGTLVYALNNFNLTSMEQEIVLAGLSQGIYTVKIATDNNYQWTEKLVKL